MKNTLEYQTICNTTTAQLLLSKHQQNQISKIPILSYMVICVAGAHENFRFSLMFVIYPECKNEHAIQMLIHTIAQLYQKYLAVLL